MNFDVIVINKIKTRLFKKNETLAVAESVTAGLLQAALSQAKDASLFFHGGITAYNLGQKARHFNINTIHAEACDCVSKTVAEEMALSVVNLFCSDYGLAITGYATAMPENGIERVYAWCACAYKTRLIFASKISPPQSEDGFSTQLFYVNKMLEKFLDHLS